MESFSEDPDLWFGTSGASLKGVIPHYLSLDIAFDITVVAESDSTVDCQRSPKSPLCPCSTHPCAKDHSSCQAAPPQNRPLRFLCPFFHCPLKPREGTMPGCDVSSLRHYAGLPNASPRSFNCLFSAFSFNHSMWACHLVPAGALTVITVLGNPEIYQGPPDCYHPHYLWYLPQDSVVHKTLMLSYSSPISAM